MNTEAHDSELHTPELLLWDKEQTGRALCVPPATVDNLHRVGRLPGVIIGKHLRWKPSLVRAFVDSLEGGVA